MPAAVKSFAVTVLIGVACWAALVAEYLWFTYTGEYPTRGM
jgi:hypothetical protein